MRNWVIFWAFIYLTAVMNGCGSGKQGPAGPRGNSGQDGISVQGDPGQPGTPGTQVTIVPLCPGFTPTYPSVFPEYALCVGDTLYGVYSANGGFLSELPPGNYSSNGVNASCNLTIAANCVVTQN